MTTRQRLLATLRALRPVLEVQGVLVVGSEVPNLLEPGAAATLVDSEEVAVAVPVACHRPVKEALRRVEGLRPAEDRPSTWVPTRPGLIEVNFVGTDPEVREAGDNYVLEDPDLPLLVLAPLSLLQPGRPVRVDGLAIPVPRPATLVLEKLLSDRPAEKGDRDLLVAAGLLPLLAENDLSELEAVYRRLRPELRYAVRSSLTVLSLMGPQPRMPDPLPLRVWISALLGRLERSEQTS